LGEELSKIGRMALSQGQPGASASKEVSTLYFLGFVLVQLVLRAQAWLHPKFELNLSSR